MITFCPICETDVTVNYHCFAFKLGAGEGNVEMVSCPVCDKVLNFKRWAYLKEEPAMEDVGRSARFIEKAFLRIPQSWVTLLNKILPRLLGHYVAVQSTNHPLSPGPVKSVIKQFVEISGLCYDGNEDAEAFMRKALAQMKQGKEK